MLSSFSLYILFFLNFTLSLLALHFLVKLSFDSKLLKQKVANRQGHRWGNSFKSHLGGFSLSLNIIFTNIFLFFFSNEFYILHLNTIFYPSIIILLSGFFGFIDERYNLKSFYKLIIQIFIGILFIINDMVIDFSSIHTVNYLFTIFFIIFFFNMINMFDNIDLGLSSISVVAAIFFLVNNIDNSSITVLSIIILSFLLPFMYFNKFPSKIFMGDIGSFQLSSIFIWLIFMIYFYDYTFDGYVGSFYISTISLIIFSIPIFDFFLVISYRIYKKKNIYVGDTNHLSHLINLRIKNPNKVSIIYLVATFLLCIISYYFDFFALSRSVEFSLISLWSLLFILFIIFIFGYIHLLKNNNK